MTTRRVLLALDHMDKAPGAHAFNLSSGSGYSVKKAIDIIETAWRWHRGTA